MCWIAFTFSLIMLAIAVWKNHAYLFFTMCVGVYGILYGLAKMAGKRFKIAAYLLALPIFFYVLLTRVFIWRLYDICGYDYFLLSLRKKKAGK